MKRLYNTITDRLQESIAVYASNGGGSHQDRAGVERLVDSMNVSVKKHPLNAEGRYYVDCDTCLDHEWCVYVAPNNFRMAEEVGSAYVFKQPTTPEEEAQCKRALDECPVGAIRDDG